MKHINKKEADECWKAFFTSGKSVATRNKLVECYLPLIDYRARKMLLVLSDQADFDELYQYGFFGLLDAINKYNPAIAKFGTFAYRRISGSMLDGLRASMPYSRQLMTQIRSRIKAEGKLWQELERDPTPQELAEAMGYDIDDDRFKHSQLALYAPSLDKTLKEDGDDIRVFLDKGVSYDFSTHIMVEDIVAYGLKHYSMREMLALKLESEGVTYTEIGVALSLSESRISQMLAGIKKKLKSEFVARAA